jgi:hypothetical protein
MLEGAEAAHERIEEGLKTNISGRAASLQTRGEACQQMGDGALAVDDAEEFLVYD